MRSKPKSGALGKPFDTNRASVELTGVFTTVEKINVIPPYNTIDLQLRRVIAGVR